MVVDRRRGEELLNAGGDAPGQDLLAVGATGDRPLEGIRDEERLDHRSRHVARSREEARRCRPEQEQEQVVVVGRRGGDPPVCGVADELPQLGIGDDPCVRDAPPLLVHGRQGSRLHQEGQPQVRRCEGPRRVIGGQTAGIGG